MGRARSRQASSNACRWVCPSRSRSIAYSADGRGQRHHDDHGFEEAAEQQHHDQVDQTNRLSECHEETKRQLRQRLLLTLSRAADSGRRILQDRQRLDLVQRITQLHAAGEIGTYLQVAPAIETADLRRARLKIDIRDSLERGRSTRGGGNTHVLDH